MTNDDRDQYECLDPALAEQLWKLELADTEPALRRRLQVHVRHCPACALTLALDAEIASAVRDGKLARPAAAVARPGWPRWLIGGGGLALAASLTLALVTPPSSLLSRTTVRADQAVPTVERPVAGEVIADARPTIVWTALPGARSYEVDVRSDDGVYAWRTRSEEARVIVPADAPLPGRQRFRVNVVPVPAYLAPEGGLGSSFRRGSLVEAGWYRIRRAGALARMVGALGALVVAGGVLGWWWGRPRPEPAP
ncbi:MAG: hypothetical protein R3D98_06005 [Candidatus Krumholzibacteriia bacterium]